MLLRGVLRFLGLRVTEFYKKVGNVAVQCEAASAFVIVPGEVYTFIQISFPIIGDVVMFLEGIVEIMGMLFTHIFNAKVVYN